MSRADGARSRRRELVWRVEDVVQVEPDGANEADANELADEDDYEGAMRENPCVSKLQKMQKLFR
jgi:hypothetical protein